MYFSFHVKGLKICFFFQIRSFAVKLLAFFSNFKNLKTIDPPLVINNVERIYYSELKQELELECKVACANPSSLSYKWVNDDNDILAEVHTVYNLTNKIKYKVEAESNEEVFEVICYVSNGVNSETEFKNDSLVRFLIQYKDENESSNLEVY